jgi:hypothetical protein
LFAQEQMFVGVGHIMGSSVLELYNF